jgi:hypothetical protein
MAALFVGILFFFALLFILPLEQATQRLGEAIVWGLCALATGFSYFLFFLFITPWKLHQRLQNENTGLRVTIDEGRRAGTGQWVGVDPGELVISSVDPPIFLPGGGDIPGGIYVILRSVQITNLTRDPIVLAVKLCRILDGKEWHYSPTHLPRSVSSPMLYPSGFLRVLAEKALTLLINLDPVNGDAGNITFRLPSAAKGKLADKLSELQRCDFELDLHDQLHGWRVRKKVECRLGRRCRAAA